MNKDLFRELADLIKERDELEERITAIRAKVSDEMTSSDVDKVESAFGNFYFVARKKWTYSEAIKTAEQKLKDKKKKEEENGTATCEETKSLAFRPLSSNPQDTH